MARAPESIDVFDPDRRAKTLSFLRIIRDASAHAEVGIRVDLTGVRRMEPAGAVLLLAECYRARQLLLSEGVVILRCRDKVLNAVMFHIGVYGDDGDPPEEVSREDIRHWRPATGLGSDGEAGGTMLAEYSDRLAEKLTTDLYAGITETMTNTSHHAYIGPLGDALRWKIGRRWWALLQEREGRLTIAFCDLGIGIPRSLPINPTFEKGFIRKLWVSLGLRKTDGNAIALAVAVGRTRTGQKGRGRGLAEIVDKADSSNGGRVHIYSGRGAFVSSSGQTTTSTLKAAVQGTLILWTVPVPTEAQDANSCD